MLSGKPNIRIFILPWLLACLLLSVAPAVLVGQIRLKPSAQNTFIIRQQDVARVEFVNTFSNFELQKTSAGSDEFLRIVVDGYSKSAAVGQPELPVLGRLIEIPESAVPKVKIISSVFHDYNLSDWGYSQKIIPLQPSAPKTENHSQTFIIADKAYSGNTFNADEIVKVEYQGKMRAARLAQIMISPVKYNPVTNTLRIYEEIVAEIDFENADLGLTIAEKQRYQSLYFENSVNRAVNLRSMSFQGNALAKQPVKYVIVSDPVYRETLRPFVEWKTQKGFRVIEAYTDDPSVGKTTASIKAYLQQLYLQATPDDPAPTFVLFVGDVSQVPSFSCGTHVSDLYYCEFTGDYLPEMYYGRFWAQTPADLQAQVDKTLQYEKYEMPDPSFLGRATLIAGADATHQLSWGNGQMGYASATYFNQDHNITANTYLQPEPSGAQYAQHVLSDINQGVAFANYTAHGNSFGWSNPAFNINTINNLQNKDKYCLMIGNCCETSTYQKPCFGVEVVRAAGKGALGYIGASDLSYWDEDYWWAVGSGEITANPVYGNKGLGAYDRTFHDHGEPQEMWSPTMGQMLSAGNMAVQESNSLMKKYYWEVYCLLGDPSLMVYFSVPQELHAGFSHQLPVASQLVSVKTEPYAFVAISKDHVIYGATEADNEGIADVNIQPFSSTGKAIVTVTAQNRIPFFDTLTLISPQGAYAVINQWVAKDVEGNENGLPEPGEKLALDVSLKNLGKTASSGSKVSIASDDPYITVTDSVNTWPAIAAGDSLLQKKAFSIQIKKEVPDMHKVRIQVTCTTDTSKFSGVITIILYAPKLEHGNLQISEIFNGNGNGIPEAGETLGLKLTITNSGHSTTDSLSARMIVQYNENQYSTQKQVYNPLESGQRCEMQFPFAIGKTVPEGSTYKVFIPVLADGYHTEAEFNFTTSLQSEGFESGSISQSLVASEGSKPWTADSTVFYEGHYSARSGVIGDLDQSEMYVDAIFLADQNISFYRKVSSENGYDFLKFIIDGNEIAAWSGNKDWAKVTFAVNAGLHKLSWTYVKDEATVAGKDAAWIDDIVFPPFSKITSANFDVQVLAVPPVICPGTDVQLYAFISGAKESCVYDWNPTHQLSAYSVFNPLVIAATPGNYSVTVASGDQKKTAAINLVDGSATPPPIVSLAGDHLVSSAAEGNQWYSSTGIVNGAIAQDFYPDHNDSYYVIATGAGSCPSPPSNTIEFLGTGISKYQLADYKVFPNPFSDFIEIDLSKTQIYQGNIVLFDVFGKKIIETKSENGSITFLDTRQLPVGMYLLKIADHQSFKVVKTKF